jgi:hypothetical protein
MVTTSRRRRVLIVLIAALLIAAGCGAGGRAGIPQPSDAVDGFESTFAAFERFKVTRLMTLDGCDYLVYGRGAFISDPAHESCQVDLFNPEPRQQFDAQANADLDALVEETGVRGRPIAWAWLEYGADDRITTDSTFGFDGEWPLVYVYAPGEARSVPRKDDSSCAEPVNDDWYRSWGC